MRKGQNTKKNSKKEPGKTMKEKKAAKKEMRKEVMEKLLINRNSKVILKIPACPEGRSSTEESFNLVE